MSRIAAFALLAALSGYAQTKPNFNGTWKLNVEKSDFGMMPPPSSRVDVISQTDDLIKDDVTVVGQQGKISYTLNLKTDGTESTVHTDRDIRYSAKWDGSALAVTQKLKYEDNDVLVKANWTVSADGNTWTIASHVTSPMGEFDSKLLLERQSGTSPSSASSSPAAPKPMTSAASGGARPNFTGVWKLNTEKSDFGPIPGPESETDTIEHNDPNLKLSVARVDPQQGKQDYSMDLVINGKEENHKLGPMDVKTTSQWEGNALMVLTKLMIQDNEIVIKSAYTMAPGGKTVNVNAHLSSPMGEADQKFVFEKQ